MGKGLTPPTNYLCRLISATVASLSIALCACTAESNTKQLSPSEKLPNSPQLNVAHEADVVDSLAATYKVTRSSTSLVIADSIACQADGDAAERISMVAVEMYNADKGQFFKTIYAKKLRCLEQALVMGLSENLVVVRGIERTKALTQLRLSAGATSKKLTKQESANAKAIINQVNPALFD